MKSTVETLEKEIQKLSRKELSVFREWFVEFDSDGWDSKIEADIHAGKLEILASEALAAHKRGESLKF